MKWLTVFLFLLLSPLVFVLHATVLAGGMAQEIVDEIRDALGSLKGDEP